MSAIDRGPSLPGGIHPPDAYIEENGYRTLDGEGRVFPFTVDRRERRGDAIEVVHVDGVLGRTVPVVEWELDAEGLAFIIRALHDAGHQGDLVTRDLEYAQRLARKIIVDRAERG